MLHIIIFQVNTFFQIDFYYVDERKTDFPQKKITFFSFFFYINYKSLLFSKLKLFI